ncbi:hypothetical protein V5799_000134 [Amblyomma americanum]|uniref:Major facilitator superfamily (MFS) profile domain-containing protein n=1 Tax=Amblyomma americanum TaxID=6943 RepID=A0AAQ4D3X3_AMBAM
MDILIPGRVLSKDLLTSESFDCYDAFGHGIFQRRLLVLCTLAAFLTNAHGYALKLISKDVEYWCKQPATSNISEVAWRNAVVPEGTYGRSSRCYLYELPEDPNNTEAIPCQEWEYGDERERMSIVSEWNLVCERRLLKAAITAVHNAGASFFPFAAGPIADSIGRMPVLLTAIALFTVSTVIGCLHTSFVIYTTIKFFASGSVSVVGCLTVVSLFEVTTHENRPLHILFSITLGIILSDLWYVAFVPFELGWKLKQAIFLLPTALSPLYLCIVDESPRWLVATDQMESAEAVMLAAAEDNHFLYEHTASVIHKLKNEIARNAQRLPAIDEDMLVGCSIQRRAFVMCLSYFSVMFTAFIATYTPMNLNDYWVYPMSFAINLIACTIMCLLITKITMLALMTVWFSLLGTLQCLSSIAGGLELTIMTEALIVVSKALYFSGGVLCFVYVLELFPTAVRGTAACWLYACGRLGAVAAFIAVALQQIGRRDVAFAFAGLLLFTSIIAQRALPRATTVECAKEEAKRRYDMSHRSMEHMKRSLDSRVQYSTRSKASHETSRLSMTPRARHLSVSQYGD